MGSRTRLATTLVLFCAVALAGWHLVDRSSGSTAKAAPGSGAVPVTAATAQVKSVPDYIQSLGTAQSIDSVAVMPRVNGQIVQVLFDPGDDVTKGQPLFLIDPRPYQAALDQAQGQLDHDQAMLKQTQMDLARYQTLAATKAIPEQQAQDQVYIVKQDQGTVELDKANVENAKLNLAYCHIASPIDGRAGALLVDPGNFVQAASASSLVSITQVKPIYVSFTIPQIMLDEVRHYQDKRPLKVEAISQSSKPLGVGKLTLIDNQVSTTTGTVTMQATFPNGNEALWPGEFVSVRLKLLTRRNAITVPVETVMQGPSGSYVYVIRPNQTVQRVNVHVTARQGGIAVIGTGLSGGERVVTNGQYRLANNVKVRVQNSTAPG